MTMQPPDFGKVRALLAELGVHCAQAEEFPNNIPETLSLPSELKRGDEKNSFVAKDGSYREIDSVGRYFPAGLIESQRLIPPDSETGIVFHRQINSLVRKFLPPGPDGLAIPVQFCLIDSDTPNAFYANRSTNPVIIGLSKGLFHGPYALQSIEELLFIIGHEYGHFLLEQKQFPYGKLNEASADYYGCRFLAEAGLYREAGLQLFERWQSSAASLGVSLAQIIDPHLSENLRADALRAGLATILSEVPGRPEDRMPERPISQLGVNFFDCVRAAKHRSWMDEVMSSAESEVQLECPLEIRQLRALCDAVSEGGLFISFGPDLSGKVSHIVVALREIAVCRLLEHQRMLIKEGKFPEGAESLLCELVEACWISNKNNQDEDVHNYQANTRSLGHIHSAALDNLASLSPQERNLSQLEKRSRELMELIAKSNSTAAHIELGEVCEKREAAERDYQVPILPLLGPQKNISAIFRLITNAENLPPEELLRQLLPLVREYETFQGSFSEHSKLSRFVVNKQFEIPEFVESESSSLPWDDFVNAAIAIRDSEGNIEPFRSALTQFGVIDTRLETDQAEFLKVSFPIPSSFAGIYDHSNGIPRRLEKDADMARYHLQVLERHIDSAVESKDFKKLKKLYKALEERLENCPLEVLEEKLWGASAIPFFEIVVVRTPWQKALRSCPRLGLQYYDVLSSSTEMEVSAKLEHFEYLIKCLQPKMICPVMGFGYEGKVEEAAVQKIAQERKNIRRALLLRLEQDPPIHLLGNEIVLIFPTRNFSSQKRRDIQEQRLLRSLRLVSRRSERKDLPSVPRKISSLQDALTCAVHMDRRDVVHQNNVYQVPFDLLAAKMKDENAPLSSVPVAALARFDRQMQKKRTGRALQKWKRTLDYKIASTSSRREEAKEAAKDIADEHAKRATSSWISEDFHAVINCSGRPISEIQFSSRVSKAINEWCFLQRNDLVSHLQAREILQDLLARLRTQALHTREKSLRNLMGSSSLVDLKLRNQVIEEYCQVLLEQHGVDNRSEEQRSAVLAQLSDCRLALRNKPALRRMVGARLLEVLRSQPKLAKGVYEQFVQADKKEESLGNFAGIGLEGLVELLRQDKETSAATLDFLLTPATKESVHQYNALLQKQKSKYPEKLQEFLRRSDLREVLPALHENFWALSVELRAVLVDQLLFHGKNIQDPECQDTLRRVLDQLFPAQTPISRRLRMFAEGYVLANEDYMQKLIVSGLLAGALRVNTLEKADIEEQEACALRSFLEATPPAGGKIAQQLPGFRLPKHLLAGLSTFKAECSRPPLWEYYALAESLLPDGLNEDNVEWLDTSNAGTIFLSAEISIGTNWAGIIPDTYIFQMPRNKIQQLAEMQFTIFEQALDPLCQSVDQDDQKIGKIGKAIMRQGRRLARLETDVSGVRKRMQGMRECYETYRSVDLHYTRFVGDSELLADGTEVRFQGPREYWTTNGSESAGYLLQQKHSGVLLVHYLKDQSIADAEKRQIILAYLRKELRASLNEASLFDADPQMGNAIVEELTIKRFDAGCFIGKPIVEADFQEMGVLLGTLVRTAFEASLLQNMLSESKMLEPIMDFLAEDCTDPARDFSRQLSSLSEIASTPGQDGSPLLRKQDVLWLVNEVLGELHSQIRPGLERAFPEWMEIAIRVAVAKESGAKLRKKDVFKLIKGVAQEDPEMRKAFEQECPRWARPLIRGAAAWHAWRNKKVSAS